MTQQAFDSLGNCVDATMFNDRSSYFPTSHAAFPSRSDGGIAPKDLYPSQIVNGGDGQFDFTCCRDGSGQSNWTTNSKAIARCFENGRTTLIYL